MSGPGRSHPPPAKSVVHDTRGVQKIPDNLNEAGLRPAKILDNLNEVKKKTRPKLGAKLGKGRIPKLPSSAKLTIAKPVDKPRPVT